MDCAVVGSTKDGIHIIGESDVIINHCLVAAIWEKGIRINRLEGKKPVLARVVDTDIRNCRQSGISIKRVGSEVVVERNRISGTAWYGIRYDDASPIIRHNLVYDHVRCGIYASGKTAATVRHNLFRDCEMDGLAAWFDNRDLVEFNTFVNNNREAIIIIGNARPTVLRNIFYRNMQTITYYSKEKKEASSKGYRSLGIGPNLYYQNGEGNYDFAGAPNAVTLQPHFKNLEKLDYNLKEEFKTPSGDFGARDLPDLKSPWPLQPEEKAIGPSGHNKDEEYWTVPEKAWFGD
jgi:hypothetical protein